tara:strand:+ start:592 stop:912 length:321 start_codon:yes stop_codon:yes gene_type:complete
MANTLGIPERTRALLATATDTINVIGGADGRKSAYEPLVCRMTDHQDNSAGEVGTDTDLMAIFKSARHGEPWIKEAGTLEKVTHSGLLPPVNVSTLYPDYDYSTFE